MEDAEREIIRRTVEAYPTLKEAARVLGIGLRTLHTKLRVLGIRPAPGRRPADPAVRYGFLSPPRVPEWHSSEPRGGPIMC